MSVPTPLFTTVLEHPSPTREPAGSVEVVEDSEPAAPKATTSTNSASPPSWPKDSVLEDYIEFAHDYSESEDSILIGSILPVVSASLGRRVFIRFSGKKYTNVYNLAVTPPGFRKSTSILLAERLGRELLPPSRFLEGVTSDQALFKLYQRDPDRLLIEDEGNVLLSNWSNDAAGKIVAKRFLRLYDCRPWQQTYIKQDEEDGDVLQRIEETSTSLLIGTTYNNCRFNGLETRDGLRRRVNYYTSNKLNHTIYWPKDLDGEEFRKLCALFEPMTYVAGEVNPLSGEVLKLWKKLQDENREKIVQITGIDAASEAYGSALAEENAKVLKFAMLFEVCRWAKNQSHAWQDIQPDTLQLAANHVGYCLRASQELDMIGRRSEIREEADAILATIRTTSKPNASGEILLTKSALTHRFAANPSRRGAMTPTRLYSEIIPDLERRKFVRIQKPDGKLHLYYFKAEPSINRIRNQHGGR